ncbi:MAG: RNA-binding S4 domain-containing protein [Opitutaceae bacterium]|nr:RNA-binding S4 domain-containing protein [Opitutaceae bacterium]
MNSSSAPKIAANLHRVDRWLWTTRVFKTRALAAGACRSNRVTVGETTVKPARELQPGEIVTVRDGPDKRIFIVRDFPVKRVGAKLVPDYLEDKTPSKPKPEQQMANGEAVWARQPGAGRPTKRDRRRLVDIIEQP